MADFQRVVPPCSVQGDPAVPHHQISEPPPPRLFDQGLAAFLLGTDEPALGCISVLTLPQAACAALEPVALDYARALALRGGTCSANANANAYANSLR